MDEKLGQVLLVFFVLTALWCLYKIRQNHIWQNPRHHRIIVKSYCDVSYKHHCHCPNCPPPVRNWYYVVYTSYYTGSLKRPKRRLNEYGKFWGYGWSYLQAQNIVHQLLTGKINWSENTLIAQYDYDTNPFLVRERRNGNA
jgi:hypothetical protein